MAFSATIVGVSRAVLQINITVEFHDDATDWSYQDMLSFQNGDILTWQDVIAEVTQRGNRYKAALAREQVLISNIGAEMVI